MTMTAHTSKCHEASEILWCQNEGLHDHNGNGLTMGESDQLVDITHRGKSELVSIE